MVEGVGTRVERLRDLRKQSKPSDSGQIDESGRHRPGEDPFGKMPLLKRLMENPDLRETLLAWLLQNRHGQTGGSGPRLSPELPGGVDYGFGHLQRREEWATSSSLEEITRYCQQLEHRADWLEATLMETLKELERIEQIRQAMIVHGADGVSSAA